MLRGGQEWRKNGREVRSPAQVALRAKCYIHEESAAVEIGELDDAVFGNQDVGTFDVAVHYVIGVQEGKTRQHAIDVPAHDAFVQRPERLQYRSYATATDVLKKNE